MILFVNDNRGILFLSGIIIVVVTRINEILRRYSIITLKIVGRS